MHGGNQINAHSPVPGASSINNTRRPYWLKDTTFTRLSRRHRALNVKFSCCWISFLFFVDVRISGYPIFNRFTIQSWTIGWQPSHLMELPFPFHHYSWIRCSLFLRRFSLDDSVIFDTDGPSVISPRPATPGQQADNKRRSKQTKNGPVRIVDWDWSRRVRSRRWWRRPAWPAPGRCTSSTWSRAGGLRTSPVASSGACCWPPPTGAATDCAKTNKTKETHRQLVRSHSNQTRL